MNLSFARNMAALLFATLFAVGCKEAQSQSAAPPPAPVETITVSASDVPIFSEFPAQTYARDRVEVRGRVTGYVEKWQFRPGDHVDAGQILYILDSRPYQAAVQEAAGNVRETQANVQFAKQQVSLLQAEANLAAAESNLVKAQQDFERLKPLVEQEAAAKQDLDAATAALRAAEANVRANKANVDQVKLQTSTQIQATEGKLEAQSGALKNAELNVAYSTIKSPISGLIGDTQVPVGGLVTANSAQPLTTIVPLDPMWVKFQMSETQYVAYGRNKAIAGGAPLTLVLSDGSEYPSTGKIESVLNQVDPRTGTLELQARFPNAQGKLLPGQFGRVRFQTEERKNVVVVPQRAVQQMQSTQTVFTVGAGDKVEAHAVKTGERVGQDWVIEQGIKPGDKVIVEGQMRIRPGMPVRATPYRASVK